MSRPVRRIGKLQFLRDRTDSPSVRATGDASESAEEPARKRAYFGEDDDNGQDFAGFGIGRFDTATVVFLSSSLVRCSIGTHVHHRLSTRTTSIPSLPKSKKYTALVESEDKFTWPRELDTDNPSPAKRLSSASRTGIDAGNTDLETRTSRGGRIGRLEHIFSRESSAEMHPVSQPVEGGS